MSTTSHEGRPEGMSTSDARRNFSDIVNRVAYGKERIAIRRRGKDLVAIVPIEDITLIEKIERHLDIAESIKAIEEGDIEGWELVKEELGL